MTEKQGGGRAQQPGDDIEYWVELDERKDKISEIVNHIEEQLQEFTKIVAERGFKCSNYHIFPFDTRAISVVMGNYDNDPRSFTISLEDVQFVDLKDRALNVPILRVYSWDGDCDSLDRKDFKVVLETKEVRKINVSVNGLSAELESIYRYIAKRFDLPPL